jgi:nucleotide-binding universal stress UspA family protein
MLLATDGSPNTTRAVSRAIATARQFKARLTLVSVVYTNNEYLALAPEVLNKLVQKARADLVEIETRAQAEGIDTRVIVRQGDPHVVITALAEEIGACLIVMGSHGRKGLTRLLMGSVAEQVIGSATIPVLVCHNSGQ